MLLLLGGGSGDSLDLTDLKLYRFDPKESERSSSF